MSIIINFQRKSVYRCLISIVEHLSRTPSKIYKMISSHKVGLSLCGAFIIVFCFVKFHKSVEETQCEQTEWAVLESIADIGNYGDCGLMGRLYRVEVEGSEIKVPGGLQEKLTSWLEGKEELLKESRRQKVVQITNKVSGETTHYNPLRARRPGAQVGWDWVVRGV